MLRSITEIDPGAKKPNSTRWDQIEMSPDRNSLREHRKMIPTHWVHCFFCPMRWDQIKMSRMRWD